MKPACGPHGQWPSPLAIEALFDGTETISWLRPAPSGRFFLLSLPEEGNVLALMHLANDGTRTRVSPAGMNLRTRVHEYGGICYTFTETEVFYCNFSNQRVYRQAFDASTGAAGPALPITPEVAGGALRYADFCVDHTRQRLLCVREDHRGAGEARNTLVALPMEGLHEGEILFAASDFVASPCLSADGSRVAFQTWSHPAMPWDTTRIQLAHLAPDGRLHDAQPICANRPGALVQPRFGPDGALYFLADWSDWWNLYRLSSTLSTRAAAVEEAEAVMPIAAEICSPQWQLGQQSYAFIDAHSIVMSVGRQGVWDLLRWDRDTQRQSVLQRGYGVLENVFYQSGKVVFLGTSLQLPAAIYAGAPQHPSVAVALFSGRAPALPMDTISPVQHISYPAGAGTAHGLYYPPHNPQCEATDTRLPPLLVSVHGGPTGSARAAWNPTVQFWTSRGFAWLDVNHRGSSGYGRRFRQSLYGQWGVVDIEDILSAVQHLITNGSVDPARIAIRGSSAGGYAVLAALAASDLFRAGVSYYGVSDLEALAKDTHKFESRYLDQLIGPWPASAELYRERSPLYHIDRINAPVLLLQGMQDRVVPPNQATLIHTQLQQRNAQSRCVYFDDEGHGFRKPANQAAALRMELQFYRDVLL